MTYRRSEILSGFIWLMLVCFMGWGYDGARAAEVIDCAKIADPGERLACYDDQFRSPSSGVEVDASAVDDEVAETVGPKTKEPTAAAGKLPEPTGPAPVQPPSLPPARDTAAAAEQGTTGPERKTTFLGDEKINLTSRIKAILAGEKQKMVFQLENNQIWMQSTPRPLPFKEGDEVNIRNAFLGGYFMRSEKGVSTRVQRIH